MEFVNLSVIQSLLVMLKVFMVINPLRTGKDAALKKMIGNVTVYYMVLSKF